jgi:hypothetical protein
MVNDPAVREDAGKRDRGILSESDRRFIRQGAEQFEQEHSSPARLKREQAIQSRAYNALLDFPLLIEYFEDSDYRSIFWRDSEDAVLTPHENEELSEGIESAVAFLYLVIGPERLEPWIARGVRKGLHQQGRTARVHVEINKNDERALGEIKRRYDENGVEGVSMEELKELEQADLITEQERQEAEDELFQQLRREKVSEAKDVYENKGIEALSVFQVRELEQAGVVDEQEALEALGLESLPSVTPEEEKDEPAEELFD